MLAHLNKGSDVGSNQSSAGDSDRGDHRWNERLGFRVKNENAKNRELASKGFKLPATACSARGQLFGAVSKFAAGERLRHCCGHGFVVHSIRVRARRRSAAAFFLGGLQTGLRPGPTLSIELLVVLTVSWELCVLELVDQLGHNKYFDAAR
jgi:hypothetical protein